MPTYMRKDKHGYKFVRPIPVELQDALDKANFLKRLGHDYRRAKIDLAEEVVKSDRELAEAKAKFADKNSLDAYIKRDPIERLKSVRVSPELAGQLAALYLQGLDNDLAARREGLGDDEFDELDKNVTEMHQAINHALASGQVGRFHGTVNNMIVGRGYQLNATDPEWQELTYSVLQHLQLGYKTLKARQQGDQLSSLDLSALPPPLPAAWEKSKPAETPRSPRLSDVTPLYDEYLSTSGDKTRSTNLSIWQRFIEYNDDKLLSAATSADIFKFIKARLNDTDKPWSHGYATGRAKKVIDVAFSLATTYNLVEKNPAAEVGVLPKISAQEEEKRRKPRFPYKSHHLSKLFASEWYAPDSERWTGKMKDDLGARYWVPLLCMWHGLRVGEAVQLQTHDIDLDEVLIKIQVVESKDEVGPTRSLKNKATKRAVPIHPILIELGFLNFAHSALRHYINGPLFPAALPDLEGRSPKWGRAYEQPFLRFTRDTLEFGSGYGNHSFRHALEDRIRAAKALEPWPEGLSGQYTGRATVRAQDKAVSGEEGSEKDYGDGYAPDAILRYIRKIEYPDVQLPPPFSTWLGGRKAVSTALLTHVKCWTKT